MEYWAVSIALAFAERENRYRQRYYRQSLRLIRDQENLLEMDDFLFQKNFRLTKELVRDLVDTLEPFVRPRTNQAIPFHLQVFATLHFYGQGSYQGSIGNSYLNSMSQPSVCRSIKLVTQLILVHITPLYIKFPTTNAMKSTTKLRFSEKFGASGIIGCIDCSHISIVAPRHDDSIVPAVLYLNRKGYHSINVEAICDADEMILYANARYPGATHDSAIWRLSPIRGHMIESNDGTSFLLGDSGYPLEPWLLTPFKSPQSTQEERFNIFHKRTRNVVERTFGIVKSRFRCLLRHRTLHYDPAVAGKIVYAVFTLHNMCRAKNIALPDEDEGLEEEMDSEMAQDSQVRELQAGLGARATYVRNHI